MSQIQPIPAAPEDVTKTSDVLLGFAQHFPNDRISLGDLNRALGNRSFGILILALSLPNALPVPGIPGVSTIFGAAIIFVALQMVLLRPNVWMPEKMSQTNFSRTYFLTLIEKALPYLHKLEKPLRPRLHALTTPLAERFVGLAVILMAGLLSLPIPLGNFLPAITMCVLAIGLIERDGLFLVLGFVLTVLSAIYVAFLATALASFVFYVLGQIF